MREFILSIRSLSKNFGGITALEDIDIEVEKGTIFSLIGPNGAGKSTLFNVVTGIFPPLRGEIMFNDIDITGLPSHKICNQGVARTFQGVRLFRELTVFENVLCGQYRYSTHDMRSLIPFYKRSLERQLKQEAEKILEFMGLGGVSDHLAGELPYGLQRRVELCRCLATRPILLLIDEPAAGLNEEEKETLFKDIYKIREEGITVILIDHHMPFVFKISERIAVLNHGRKIAEGTPSTIRNDTEVKDAYLGEEFGELP
jgi:branched-chain amino acid transport system ATP-binding protein